MATPRLVCFADVYGGGGSQIISGHLEQPAVIHLRLRIIILKRIKFQDFT